MLSITQWIAPNEGCAYCHNVENLADIRQTKYDSLIRPVRLADGRWTVEAWAPLDGRVWNGGVRIGF